jgi:hypothetical protein
VNIKIAGKWMFIPLKMVLIGIDHSHIITIPWYLKIPRKELPPFFPKEVKEHLRGVGSHTTSGSVLIEFTGAKG